MRESLMGYFAAEKTEGVVFLCCGLAALAAAVVLRWSASDYRGMAWPLAAVGLIQVAAFVYLWGRTDGQVERLLAQLAAAPAEFRAVEGARMAKVIAGFHLYAVVEIVLLAAGVGMSLAWKQRLTLHAVGLGLILQASVMLVLDQIAERRAVVYAAAVAQVR